MAEIIHYSDTQKSDGSKITSCSEIVHYSYTTSKYNVTCENCRKANSTVRGTNNMAATFSRRHYQAIADSINRATTFYDNPTAEDMRRHILMELVTTLRGDNPRFDMDRFFEAVNRPMSTS